MPKFFYGAGVWFREQLSGVGIRCGALAGNSVQGSNSTWGSGAEFWCGAAVRCGAIIWFGAAIRCRACDRCLLNVISLPVLDPVGAIGGAVRRMWVRL